TDQWQALPSETRAGIYIFDAALLVTALGKSVAFPDISPFVAFSRIEDKNNLAIAASRPDTNSPYIVSPIKTIDLLQYSNLMLGADLTLSRSTFSGMNLNMKFRLATGFFRTPVDSFYDASSRASLSGPVNLMSWYLTPEIILQPIHSDRIEYD